MFRFLKSASSSSNGISFPKLGISQSMSCCTLCQKRNLFFSDSILQSYTPFIRQMSTEELTRLGNSFKKGNKSRKFKKKFTELVEVKADCSNVTKAAVRKLSSKDVSKLTEKPEMSLENVHISQDRSKTPVLPRVTLNSNSNCDKALNEVNSFFVSDEDWENRIEAEIEFDLIGRDTENVAMFSESSAYQYSGIIPEAILSQNQEKEEETGENDFSNTEIQSKNLNRKKTKSSSTNKKLKVFEKHAEEERLKEIENQTKNRIFQEHLVSYVEACVHCDFLNLAFNTVARYLNKNRVSRTNIFENPEPFNNLIHGFAGKGDIDKVMDLLRMITSCNIEFNLQTFIGCFECLSNLKETPTNKEKKEIILKQFSAYGFTFQDLFARGVFVENQREKVLSFIQSIDPNFAPYYEPYQQHYSCSLLQHLNDEDQLWRSPAENSITHDELMKYSNDQMQIELQPFQNIVSVAKPTFENKDIKICRRKWQTLENEWRETIRTAFDTNLKHLEIQLQNTKLCHDVNIYPYLKLLRREEYVDIIIAEVNKLLRGSETFSPCLKVLHIEIGKQVKLRFDVKRLQKNKVTEKMNDIYTKYCEWYLNPSSNCNAQNAREQWQHLIHESAGIGPSIDDRSNPWPSDLLKNIGKFLYKIIIDELKLDVNIFSASKSESLCSVSAFNELPRTHGKFIREEIKPHPLVAKLYRIACVNDLCFNIDLLPMVSPPIPWISTKHGGYLLKKAEFVRLFDSMPNALNKADNRKLLPIFDALNQLAAVPWRMNTPILDLMIEVFVAGGSDKLKIPRPASSFNFNSECAPNKTANLSYVQKLYATRRKGEMHSLWCEALYRLSLANHYRDRIVWLPHNLDFRGRVYPVPPHLTHIGSDLARALLRFAKGEPLGPQGLDWLKIHCINLTGLKKRSSTEERLRYANEILPDILDSAERPLTGKMWWATSEEMWQTLACCLEIKAAIDSGDAEKFVSFFPVHQDGSCNGLQHYAALGRDQVGGQSVNLTPSPVPQDVYSCVVAMVEQERIKDAEQGNSIALALDGFIKRKIIKQTVMTTVYGVTKFGARLQIAKQLKDVEAFPPHLVWEGSLYLTSKTFHCLREMFTSTRKIQDWLTDCAKVISSERNSCVEWETPVGLPVIQPYMKTKCTAILNGKAIYNTKPNGLKQKSAFSPNYIHSLDSSHMMLTSIMCERRGITFVSVHDCFWTHASSVKLMSQICREQFVSLHSEPILENLSEFFIKKYAASSLIEGNSDLILESPFAIFKQVPEKGTLNLTEILRSEFFFS